jgi:hypothetical protein
MELRVLVFGQPFKIDDDLDALRTSSELFYWLFLDDLLAFSASIAGSGENEAPVMINFNRIDLLHGGNRDVEVDVGVDVSDDFHLHLDAFELLFEGLLPLPINAEPVVKRLEVFFRGALSIQELEDEEGKSVDPFLVVLIWFFINEGKNFLDLPETK